MTAEAGRARPCSWVPRLGARATTRECRAWPQCHPSPRARREGASGAEADGLDSASAQCLKGHTPGPHAGVRGRLWTLRGLGGWSHTAGLRVTQAEKEGHRCGRLHSNPPAAQAAGWEGEGRVRQEWSLDGPTPPTGQGKESQKSQLGETDHVLM